MIYYSNLAEAIACSKIELKQRGLAVDNDRWQGMNTKGTPKSSMWELLHHSFQCPIPPTVNMMNELCRPNNQLNWVDRHFEERVGGKPTNPGDTYMDWPYYPKNDSNIRQEKFTHTYQERLWPKLANGGQPTIINDGKDRPHFGIRYHYGDLKDAVQLLYDDPMTRQCYIPIWFPEDTGAVHKGRVPCTLGYWIVNRNGRLDITYYIRAVDAIRHFNDDVYLACRLLDWIRNSLASMGDTCNTYYWANEVKLGNLVMHIGSFHVFEKERNIL